MAKILLGVTGSVAAIRTPALVKQLHSAGHQVKVVATDAALYFFDPREIDRGLEQTEASLISGFPHLGPVIRDEDEWPGRESGRLYQRDDLVLHIELRRWAEVVVRVIVEP